ncbi:hypothetical protein LTR62_005814 [Meristemomyces frigidus]|uniref:Duf1665 domain containing protein n=1 Tax=Meristemomyces frigidus TaxID=1508187 RepID=A0AAN7TD20_9PEZI|nr:hypothetical protein LTR62_005814 [Meristemomyces frigidus]
MARTSMIRRMAKANASKEGPKSSRHNSGPFPTAIEDWTGTQLTVPERHMMALLGSVTDKDDWRNKMNVVAIQDRWRRELSEMPTSSGDVEFVRPEGALDYCLAELADYARFVNECGFLPALDATATVYKSDTIVPFQLRTKLCQAAARLEAEQADDLDWHPGSNGTVLDLVHPSLFPLVYGETPVMDKRIGSMLLCSYYTGLGEPVAGPETIEQAKEDARSSLYDAKFYSDRFQWLPCEVDIAETGSAKITSYINNLHPRQHGDLYQAIEQVIGLALPMLSATLASTRDERWPGRPNSWSGEYDNPGRRPPRITVGSGENLQWTPPRPVEEHLRRYDDDEDELMQQWRDRRIPHCPEPEPYAGRANDPADLRKQFDLQARFRNQGLQVIVKLANIVLTPENPTYDGGSWHVEGQLNEHICATALYYYSSSNITDSHLGFRETLGTEYEDWEYEQSEYDHLERLYDIENGGLPIQNLGSVLTREGRLLTFPNVMQHRVHPFTLQDPSQPGHRKLLALFLVDPHLPIPSTATVPPQQKHWWSDVVLTLDAVADLPLELAERIVESAGEFPYGLSRARELREELMGERSALRVEVGERMEERAFNFCEH